MIARQIAIASAVLFLGSCGNPETHTAPAERGGRAVKVSVAAVAQTNWPEVYEAVGTVRARTSSVISSRMMGSVQEVKVRVGDRVSAGQVLVILDSRDLEARDQQAEAAVAEGKSALPEVESAVAAAKAQFELAETTFRRMQDLFEKKSISNQEYDESAARLKVAQANYNLAQAKPAQVRAKIQQAEQALRSSQIGRGYAQISAPFSGIVVEKTVEPGALATLGTPLMTIEQEGSWRLEASVEESKQRLVGVGQKVEVALDAVDRTVQGRVSEIVPSVDAGSRSFIVKIDLPLLAQLRGGQFGRARFTFGQRSTLVVPAAAVRERGQLQTVFVAEGDAARTRMVTLGEKRGDQVEVLSGLSAGDRVIVPAPTSLQDGAKIEVSQ